MFRNQCLLTVFAMAIMGLLYSCSTIPQGVTAVSPFEKDKYLGKWYEIARLDHSFERGLNNITAEYSLCGDGKINVKNRGYDYKKNAWREVVGKAKFVKEESTAMLKVSFFGPFYSGYNVIAIDSDYKYALVCGKSTDYLWILSRGKNIPEKVRNEYLEKAQGFGFNTSNLLWVEHNLEAGQYEYLP